MSNLGKEKNSLCIRVVLSENSREAGEIIRGLVDEICLVPDGEDLRIHLKGELAEMLVLSANAKPGAKGTVLKSTLVAGAATTFTELL